MQTQPRQLTYFVETITAFKKDLDIFDRKEIWNLQTHWTDAESY